MGHATRVGLGQGQLRQGGGGGRCMLARQRRSPIAAKEPQSLRQERRVGCQIGAGLLARNGEIKRAGSRQQALVFALGMPLECPHALPHLFLWGPHPLSSRSACPCLPCSKCFAVGLSSLSAHPHSPLCYPLLSRHLPPNCIPAPAFSFLNAGQRFAVGLSSLTGHQLAGEERFQVELHADGSVW